MITCYFCEQEFEVSQVEMQETVAFCPFCGNEVIDHETVTAFVVSENDED